MTIHFLNRHLVWGVNPFIQATPRLQHCLCGDPVPHRSYGSIMHFLSVTSHLLRNGNVFHLCRYCILIFCCTLFIYFFIFLCDTVLYVIISNRVHTPSTSRWHEAYVEMFASSRVLQNVKNNIPYLHRNETIMSSAVLQCFQYLCYAKIR